MTNRRPTLSLLYSSSASSGWARVLSSLIDEGLGSLCMRQWQRAAHRSAFTYYVASGPRVIFRAHQFSA